MTSGRNWWHRAAAAVKDSRSLCAARLSAAAVLNPEFEAAVIRATSHDERSADHKAAARVLSLARTSPSLLDPLMHSVARRAARTRSWAVALKSLMLAHGLILRRRGGLLPFDLSDFRDRSRAWGLSAFIRAYFRFLDRLAAAAAPGDEMEAVERMQELLDLVMQVRPYGDGAEGERVVLEAMECAVVEAFDIFNGISGLLAGVLVSDERRRRGIRAALQKAAEQSAQLAAYVELCRRLGVPHMAELPAAGRISEEIAEMERIVMGGIPGQKGAAAAEKEEEKREMGLIEGTVVTAGEWVVFEDEELATAQGCLGNSFSGGSPSCVAAVHRRCAPPSEAAI